MIKFHKPLSLITLSLLISSQLFSSNQSVEDLLSESNKLYQDNQKEEVIQILNQTIDLIKDEIAKDQISLLPEIISGWKTIDIQSNFDKSPFGQFAAIEKQKTTFELSASYESETNPQIKVNIKISNKTHEIQMQKTQIEMNFNPAFLEAMQKEAPTNIQQSKIHGCDSFLETNTDQNQILLTLFGFNHMIQITCKNTVDEGIPTIFADLINWNKIKLEQAPPSQ